MTTSLQSDNQAQEIDEQLLTVRQFCSLFPWPSESALRAYIFRADEVGIEDAIVRVGRRVLVNPTRFFNGIQKIEEQSKAGGKNEALLSKKQRKVCL